MHRKQLSTFVWDSILLFVSFIFVIWVTIQFDEISKYQILGSMVVFFAYTSIYYLIPRVWNIPLFFLFNGLYYFYQIAQRVYFEAFGEFFRLGMVLSMTSEIEGSMKSIAEFVRIEYFIPLIVLLVVTVVFFVLQHRKSIQMSYKVRVFLAVLALSISISGFMLLKYKLESTRENVDSLMLYQTDYYVYYSVPSTTQFVDKLGFINLFIRDLEVLIQTSDLKSEYGEEIKSYMSERQEYQNNELTGLFEGKSILFVQAESLMNLGIDETLTPTLYQMMKEGITVDGYNSPLMAGSTSATEMLVHTSLFPLSDDGYNASMKYMNNTYPKTLTKYFKESGYPTYVFHNNYAEFYSRDIVMPNYGYDYFYDCEALGIDLEYADSAYFEIAKWILLEKEQFMAYWITFNGHQPYDYNLQPEVAQYISLVEQVYPNLSEKYVSYMAKNIDLDRTLRYFLDNVEDAGKNDEIVIVLCGDHLAKGLQSNEELKNALLQMGRNTSDEAVNNSLKTPLTFYLPSQDLSTKSVSKVSNTVDILPTICNLWGFQADSSYHLGFDIFDECYTGFCFDATDTYYTESFQYNYVTHSLEMKTESMFEQEAMQEVNDIIQRFEISKHLLEIDFFKEMK